MNRSGAKAVELVDMKSRVKRLLGIVALAAAAVVAQDSRPAWKERLDRERRDVEERHRIAAEFLASEEDRLASALAALKARRAEADTRIAALKVELERQAELRSAWARRRDTARAATDALAARAVAAADELRRRSSAAAESTAAVLLSELARVGDATSPAARRLSDVAALAERLLLDLRTVTVTPKARDGRPGTTLRLGGLGEWWIPETGDAIAVDGRRLDAEATTALRDLARRAARLETPAVLRLPRGLLP